MLGDISVLIRPSRENIGTLVENPVGHTFSVVKLAL